MQFELGYFFIHDERKREEKKRDEGTLLREG